MGATEARIEQEVHDATELAERYFSRADLDPARVPLSGIIVCPNNEISTVTRDSINLLTTIGETDHRLSDGEKLELAFQLGRLVGQAQARPQTESSDIGEKQFSRTISVRPNPPRLPPPTGRPRG